MAIGYRNPSHFHAMHSAATVNYFFKNAHDANIAHKEALAAGRKPRTTRLVDHRDANGNPVYYWKVTTLDPQ